MKELKTRELLYSPFPVHRFPDLIRTVPIGPSSGNIVFSAEGLLHPINEHNLEPKEVDKKFWDYLNTAEARGIMPLTRLHYQFIKLEEGRRDWRFLPVDSTPCVMTTQPSIEFLDRTLNLISKGGRHQYLFYELTSPYMFDEFNKIELPARLEQGYKIVDGTLFFGNTNTRNSVLLFSNLPGNKESPYAALILREDSLDESIMERLPHWFIGIEKSEQYAGIEDWLFEP